MRKMLIIIGILLIIFLTMVFQRANTIKNRVNGEDVEQIQNYIEKIYLWKEVTGQALPTFDNINNADDKWIWEVVKNNLENYDTSKEDLDKKVKEIFGQECNKQIPEGGNSSFIYNNETGKYDATDVELDNKKDSFLIDNITKNKQEYQVVIIEYLVDYSDESNISIENTNEEKVRVIGVQDNEVEIQNIVKENKDKFTKKTLTLEKENEKLIIKKVT